MKSGVWTVGWALAALSYPLSASAQDSYEPDNYASSAGWTACGRTQNRSIHAVGDVDWIRFEVERTLEARNVVLETSGAAGDTQMWLLRGNGTTVAYDDDSGEGAFSRIEVAELPAGTYFIKVQEYNNNEAIPAYDLTLNWTPVADAYENDNYASAAKGLVNGQTQMRSIHAAGNVDWAKLVVGGLGARFLHLTIDGHVGDTEMWLIRGNGTAVAYDDDSGGGDFSMITVASLPPGTYYIKISERLNNDTIAEYSLRGDWTTIYAPDAYENDNYASAAKPIANGEAQTRSLHAMRNEDWAKFTVPGGGAQNVVVETAGANGDPEMFLLRGNGSQVAYDDDSGAGDFARIAVAALTPGTYYIRIRGHDDNDTIESYTLRVDWSAPAAADAYEADDSAGAAKAIANGQTQNRTIHAAGNVDWAKIVIPAAGARNLVLETAGASGDTQLWVFRGNGTQAGYDDNSGAGDFSRIAIAALPPGTYFVKVQENGNNSTIPAYTLRAGWTSP